MAGLQRSEISFRRQGSSGLVWDDKFLNSLNQKDQDQNKAAAADHDDQEPPSSTSVPPINVSIERSRSNGGGRAFRTGRVSPAFEPPSPRVSACGLCSAFGKKNSTRRRPKSGKRKI